MDAPGQYRQQGDQAHQHDVHAKRGPSAEEAVDAWQRNGGGGKLVQGAVLRGQEGGEATPL
jgi:hypothetical protein